MTADDTAIRRAYENGVSRVLVEGQGVVRRLLSDDDDGRRHQRFVVELASGQTVLVAHNIDVAPRVAGLKEGHVVAFCGEYEWTAEGGTIHWTHRDETGRHPDGRIRYNGRTYW